jgi:hypothetical protein
MKDVVGRAEYKIADAAKALGVDFRGKVVLDIGSSTGGFTEFALRSGAEKVIAVEKGTNQMKAPLRFAPEVELYEKTDIFDFVPDEVVEAPIALLDHCRIFKGSAVKVNSRVAKILEYKGSTEDEFDYYIQYSDTKEIACIKESCIKAAFLSGKANPTHQLKRFEFHNPCWYLGRQIVKDPTKVTDETFDELHKYFSDSEIVAIVGYAGQMIATNNFNSVLKIDVDKRLLPIINEFKPVTWRDDIK